MVNPIGEILPLATGVAISPMPIIAIILMLFSKRAKSNSLTFLVGWVLGLSVVSGVVISIASTQNISSGGAPSTAASIVRLLLGVLLLFLAAKQWRSRPKPGEQATMPKWMKTIDAFTPGKTLGLALLLSALNPKNVPLTLAAALDIAQANLSSFESIVMLAIFILIGSITVAAPVVVFLVMGDKAAKTLDGWKVWLTESNATVMFVLFLVLGLVVFGKGISSIFG